MPQAPQALLDLQAQPAPLVLQVLRVQPAHRAQTDPPDHKDHVAHKDPQVPQVQLDHKAHKDP